MSGTNRKIRKSIKKERLKQEKKAKIKPESV